MYVFLPVCIDTHIYIYMGYMYIYTWDICGYIHGIYVEYPQWGLRIYVEGMRVRQIHRATEVGVNNDVKSRNSNRKSRPTLL